MKINDKIIEVDIDKVKPDPNQPRTYIDEEDLHEMSQSITSQGIINPIEIDQNFVIVTGERRWRAAKLAGEKKVRAVVVEIQGDERFMRQVVENIHHNTMSDWDTANALKRLLTMVPSSILDKTTRKEPDLNIGITWVSKSIGRTGSYIREKLNLLDAPPKFREAVEKGMTGSFIRVLTRAPEQFRDQLEKKILDGQFKSREGALHLVAALKREESNPKVTKKLMDTDYSKYTSTNEISNAVNQISPPFHEMVKESFKPDQQIAKIAHELADWVTENPRPSIAPINRTTVSIHMKSIIASVYDWLGKKSKDLPLLDK